MMQPTDIVEHFKILRVTQQRGILTHVFLAEPENLDPSKPPEAEPILSNDLLKIFSVLLHPLVTRIPTEALPSIFPGTKTEEDAQHQVPLSKKPRLAGEKLFDGAE